MKKLIRTVIALLLVFSVAGCTKPETQDDKVIKVGKYEGVKGTLTKVKVTDEDVQAEIDNRLAEAATTKTVKKGKVKKGDTIVIDYTGRIDGKEFEIDDKMANVVSVIKIKVTEYTAKIRPIG